MKPLMQVSILFLLIFYFSSCKKDLIKSPIITKNYDLSAITKVSIQGICDANIYYGTSQKVELTGPEDKLEKAEVYVDGTTLIIKIKVAFQASKDVVIEITIPKLELIEIVDESRVWVGVFSGLDDLGLSISGNGSIFAGSLDLGQNKLTTDISGSGDIEVRGLAASNDVSISGSGNYEGFGMTVNSCKVDISGSGDVEVMVNNDLDVDISGSGTVSYKGQPIINNNIAGSGNIVDAN